VFEHVEELLVGQYPKSVPTASIKQIVPHVEEELRTNEDFTLWQQRYSVTVDRVIKNPRTAAQLLESMSSLLRTTAPQDADPTAPPSHLPAGQIIRVDSDS
jgi:hypothetical protein